MNTKMDTREELRPYRNRKLGLEGVLIDVIEPNAQNKQTYGLVFGSVYAPNERIELDHAVIKVNKYAYQASNVKLFNRYRFTAFVESYRKVKKIEGIEALSECYMLVRPHIIEVMENSNLQQPTQFVKSRIECIMMCKSSCIQHNEAELYEMISNLKNDGDVEEFIGNYTRRYQHKKVTQHDIRYTIYRVNYKRPKVVS
ncbi:hypothetical protein [Paenibacillus glucanolyticus]|uniref:hypothetical protein n=1 Tax=Paenibacillus glucanolyticus TaxID=59843 RepID=UPI00096D0450|nr:hypothetical protein [Paenibacillus glucanolyticus]OMF76675.1 hypothetical protein BK142_14220 [Paenibacillus glucanolyticus]